ncbi:MAG: DUF4386 domain-containing protein [Cyclobacteriaceae bacterium]|nr:DUF4386 domain-containing protein [Cyclobacteriaceae bacterium]
MQSNNDSSQIFKARTIGSFFLLAFLAYGFGRHLFDSEVNSENYIGALLIIINSIMVLFIGILFRQTLQKYNALVGNIYLFTRVFESIALASIVLNVMPTVRVSEDYGYFLAMLILGLGSIPMCFTLYKHKISPSWLAIWGITGYGIFSFGFLMELFEREWSMYLLILAALWEITFAIWLITKGGQGAKLGAK